VQDILKPGIITTIPILSEPKVPLFR
jgi:hypothetical protein